MKKFLLFISMFVLILLAGCHDDTVNPEPNEYPVDDMGDLNVADDFDWKTTDLVLLKVEGLYNGTVRVADDNGNNLYRGFHNMFTHLSTMISIPDKVNNVVVTYQDNSESVPVVDGKIQISFIE